MVNAFGILSTIALETEADGKVSTKDTDRSQSRRLPSLQTRVLARTKLTSVEVLLVLGFVVPCVPGVLFAVLTHLNHKHDFVLVPLVVLHSLYVRFLFTLDTILAPAKSELNATKLTRQNLTFVTVDLIPLIS